MAGDDSEPKTVEGWLDLMLVQCSCAYFGWSYVKSESKNRMPR